MSTLVIGVGNPDRGDDGFGPAVVDELRKRGLHAETAVVTSAARLLDVWEDRDHVVLIDAARSGGAPGTLDVIDASDAKVSATDTTAGTHGLGVAQAIAVARATGQLPRRVTVVTVEAESFTIGHGLTAAVARSIAPTVDRVVQLLS